MDEPLSAAVAVVQAAGDVLLVERQDGDFTGRWGFPGGKVELDEFLQDAVTREVAEETGLDAAFDRHCGVVSEQVVDSGRVRKHVLLHVCTVAVDATGTLTDPAAWVPRERLDGMRGETVPSLVPILELVEQGDWRYAESVVSETAVERFERVC